MAPAWPAIAGMPGMSSSSTIADLPPSSRAVRFTCGAVTSRILRPTAVEPVNEIMSTRGSTVICSPMLFCDDVIALNTPGGMSVFSWMKRPRSSAHHGVAGAPFSTTVQPAASAQHVFLRFSSWGKFQALITPTTPTGSRSIQRCAFMPKAEPTPRSSAHSYFSRKSA